MRKTILARYLIIVCLFYKVFSQCDITCAECLPMSNICRLCTQNYELNLSGKCEMRLFPNSTVIDNVTPPDNATSNMSTFQQKNESYNLENEESSLKALNQNQTSNPDMSTISNISRINGSLLISSTGNQQQQVNLNTTDYIKQSVFHQPNQSTSNINVVSYASYPNCISFNGISCIQCQRRYYLSIDGHCIAVNPLCKQFDSIGSCTQCYPGYQLTTNNCIKTEAKASNCKTLNGQQCIQCLNGFIMNSTSRLCTRVNPLCRQSSIQTGVCLSCYYGYSLNSVTGNCQIWRNDANCITFMPNTNFSCLQCADRFFLNYNGICSSVDPLCNTYDTKSGNCTSCYLGYLIHDGVCIFSLNTDPFCHLQVNNTCTQCFAGYYLGVDGLCVEVDPLCRTFNTTNGDCTSCYLGYRIYQNYCILDRTKDYNCRQFDIENESLCLGCYDGYYISEGKCKVKNTLCKTIDDSTGNCTSCYLGYYLSNWNCQISVMLSPILQIDPYCVKFANNSCVQCSSGFYYNSDSYLCKQINPLCRTTNMSNGNCLTCYTGFILNPQFNCQIAPIISIPNCFTIINGICLECILGYYVKNNICTPVSILCASYDKSNGLCTSCVVNHYLQYGECIYVSKWDSNCISYQMSSYCSQCRMGYRLLVPDYSCVLDTSKFN